MRSRPRRDELCDECKQQQHAKCTLTSECALLSHSGDILYIFSRSNLANCALLEGFSTEFES